MRILFVCTGNTCRSAMAEAIARKIAHDRGLDLEFASAGTSAWEGAPASDGALLVSMERGIELSGHSSRLLSPELLGDTDLVLVMGPHHLERVEAVGGRGKAHLLHAYASGGESDRPVNDPFGGDLDTYRSTFEELEDTIGRALDRVVSERGERR